MVDWVSSKVSLGVGDLQGEDGWETSRLLGLSLVTVNLLFWLACKVFLLCSRKVVDRDGFSDLGGF